MEGEDSKNNTHKKKLNFKEERMDKPNEKYSNAIKREELYKRHGDIRSPFARDYTRILHCFGFRRLKHKTQVFFTPRNDHICTRMEHALHVASISVTISKELGLNTELIYAISIGHDLGHAPFGHYGESVLDNIYRKEIKGIRIKAKGERCKYFWHERHGLRTVENFETVKDPQGYQRNLYLTYAVRDGIICHCGEGTFKKPVKPRKKYIGLSKIDKPGKKNPYTWEGCIVKISDLLSYLGRDIEDAEMCGIVDDKDLCKLKKSINSNTNKIKIKDLSNSVIIHELIIDLCNTSNPKSGLCFSDDGHELIDQIHKFNYENIYYNEKLKAIKENIDLTLKTLFYSLNDKWDGNILDTLENMKNRRERIYKVFIETWLERFHEELENYDYVSESDHTRKYVERPYNITNKREYSRAIIDYLAGFTDNFANTCYQEIVSII